MRIASCRPRLGNQEREGRGEWGAGEGPRALGSACGRSADRKWARGDYVFDPKEQIRSLEAVQFLIFYSNTWSILYI